MLYRTWTIVASILVPALVIGWSLRERTFPAHQDQVIKSRTVNLSDLKFKEIVYKGKPHGQAAIYFEGKTVGTRKFIMGIHRIRPGAEPHPIHTHAEEELLIVTGGHGEITCAGKTTKIGPGSVMFTEPDVPHGVKNTGDKPLTFYFVKYRGVKR